MQVQHAGLSWFQDAFRARAPLRSAVDVQRCDGAGQSALGAVLQFGQETNGRNRYAEGAIDVAQADRAGDVGNTSGAFFHRRRVTLLAKRGDLFAQCGGRDDGIFGQAFPLAAGFVEIGLQLRV